MLLICDLAQKLICKVIAIIDQNVVRIGQVSLSHARNNHVVNLELSLGKHTLLGVLRIVNWYSILEREGSVLPRVIDVDTTLVRIYIAAKGEFLLANLDSCVVCAQPNRVCTPITISQVAQVVDIDEDRANLLLPWMRRLSS